MGVMRTLTINGQKYTVDDPNAVQIPETAPEKGTVPTSDGEGGTEWEKPSGSEIPSDGTTGQVLTKTEDGFGWADVPVTEDEIVTVTVTGSESTSWKADKTITELIAAHNAGKTLRCLLNGDYAASLAWFDNDASIPAMWFVGPVHLGHIGTIAIGSTTAGGTACNVSVNAVSEFVLPDGGTDGQFLTLTDGSLTWTNLPEQETELPTGGSNGQVLTLVSGSPAWADVPETEDEIPTNGTTGQVLTKTSAGYGWEDLPEQETELPTGGSAGQVLTKESDGSVSWNDVPQPEDEIPTGGTKGQVLTNTGSGYGWADLPEQEAELPDGGTEGQVLTIGSDGSPVWADPTTLTSVYEGVF